MICSLSKKFSKRRHHPKNAVVLQVTKSIAVIQEANTLIGDIEVKMAIALMELQLNVS